MEYFVLAAIPCQQYHKEYLEQTGREKCRFVFYPELYGNWPETKTEEDILKRFPDKPKEWVKGLCKDFMQVDIIIGEPPLSLVKELPHLKWIQMTWAGTDIYTAKEKLMGQKFPEAVKLTNMSGAYGTIIAEYVMGAVLYFYRNFNQYTGFREQALWQKGRSEESLEGKNVLILGAGDIGTQTAKRMQAFGAYVVGFRRNIVDKPPYFDEICGQMGFREQLKKADVIIGCLPNSSATAGMIGKNELESMKKNAVFINVGRGNLVKTEELVEVLRAGHLRGVGLDVTDPEPLPKNHPLWKEERVLITPHVAGVGFGHCKNTEDKIIRICGENMIRFVEGRNLRNEIR